MTVLSVGQIQSVAPSTEIVIDSGTKLSIEGPLRVTTIQNSSGLTTLTSNSAGTVTITGNLSTTSTLTTNISAPSRLVIPIWTTATRPSNPSAGTFGYNNTTKRLESYSGTRWDNITNSLIT